MVDAIMSSKLGTSAYYHLLEESSSTSTSSGWLQIRSNCHRKLYLLSTLAPMTQKFPQQILSNIIVGLH
jgi:hypothetical protein